ncbi:MAG: 3-dehydroquinate synthase [bacterium]|nr:3-dehydroquinate synthase [bacterium]
METINVDLGERSYPIYIDSNILASFGERLKIFNQSKRVVIVTNPTVAKLYLEVIESGLNSSGVDVKVVEIPDGEEYKSLKWAGRIYDELISFEMDRNSPLIALGGGVIGDITGFVASTYMRGVPYVQVPTTLLAQVDSSVGGKTAVNHPKGKNMIGAFYQPLFVYIDVKTLDTLDPREVRAGLAEVVKYGIIKSEELFSYLENNTDKVLSLDEVAIKHIIKVSCKIKASVVATDEREGGLRAILNFGHTFGHAVEALTNYRQYRHGEAVAIGMLFAARLSHKIGVSSDNTMERLSSLLKKIGLPLEDKAYSAAEYIKSMMHDKKVVAGELRFVLPESMGSVTIENVQTKDCEALITT